MNYLLVTLPHHSFHHHFPLLSTTPTITNHFLSQSLQPLPKCKSKLDPNAESFKPQKKFNFIFNNDNKITERYYYENDDGDDDDDKEEEDSDGMQRWVEVWEEYIDSIWFLKVIGSYGWASPIIILSILLSSGPKAFLMALALPLGQSTFSFAFQKIQDSAKNRSKSKRRTVKKSRARRSRTVRPKRTMKVKTGYQSWVPRRNVSADKPEEATSSFGGWDELDSDMDLSGGSSMKSGPTLGRSRKTAPEERKFSSVGRKGDQTPLLLRLLISVFPFLSSWTKIL